MKSLVSAFLVVIAAASGAHAESLVPCAEAPGRTYAVAGVTDGETLVLDSGEELRLTGVLAPKPPPGQENAAWAPHEAAVASLKEMTLGRRIEVRAVTRPRDRYQRLTGHAIVLPATPQEGMPVWLEAAVVQAGHARVLGMDDLGACEAALLAREAEARRARRGLWANEIYRVRSAVDERELMSLAGTFQIVEGRVSRVAVHGARAYLDFGADWKRDFSVIAGDGVLKPGEGQKALTREARSALRRTTEAALQAFEGQHVRVRGWIRIRNGPMIEIRRLEDIERVPR